MSDTPFPTFHAFHFTPDLTNKAILVLSNTEDKSLSWVGDICSDAVLESVRDAIKDMVTNNDHGPYRTIYGELDSVR